MNSPLDTVADRDAGRAGETAQRTALVAIKPTLYHAPSSYFSMIARLALAEAGVDYEPVHIEIHLRSAQHSPAYARLNSNMTIPTLVLPKRVLDQSRDIMTFALTSPGQELDAETIAWVDLHYAYPIEELTFGGLLAEHALARAVIPGRMAASRRRLLRLAAAFPDLAECYQRRADVFAERGRTFDPKTVRRLAASRREQAIGLLDHLEGHLAGQRTVMVPPGYGAADVVWTVFLARIEFVGMGAEIDGRPALANYWLAMKRRPSFAAADIWTRLHFGRLLWEMVHG